MGPRRPLSAWLRHTSLVTCALFLYVNVVYAAVEPAKNFWQERKEAAAQLNVRQMGTSAPQNVTLLAQLPALQIHLLPGQSSRINLSPSVLANLSQTLDLPHKSLPKWIDTVSASHVTLKDLFLPASWKPGDPMVIHIQDAHGNVQAQTNIAHTLESLASSKLRSQSLIVGIEGAWGGFDFNPYRSFPDPQTTKDIAKHFLEEGLITGPEYVGMASVNLPEFWGVENKDLYFSHLKALKKAVKLKQKIMAQVEKSVLRLNQAKIKILNPALQELDLKVTQYHKGTIGIGDYIKHLKPSPRNSTSAIKLFLSALELEDSLNYKQVEKERALLTRALSNHLSKFELENLVKASLAYRTESLTHSAFYQYLKELCSNVDIKIGVQYPEMDQYIRYVLLSDRIKPENLLGEVDKLQRIRMEELIQTEQEKELMQFSEKLALTEKLVKFQLSPEDWKNYLENSIQLEGLSSEMLVPFEGFNKAAIARNSVLIDNLLSKSDASLSVLIAGGFHTDGMMEILKSMKIAYAVLTPRLGKTEGSGSDYLDVFTRDKTPLEKLFTGERIQMAARSIAQTSNMGPRAPVVQRTYVVHAYERVKAHFEQFRDRLRLARFSTVNDLVVINKHEVVVEGKIDGVATQSPVKLIITDGKLSLVPAALPWRERTGYFLGGLKAKITLELLKSLAQDSIEFIFAHRKAIIVGMTFGAILIWPEYMAYAAAMLPAVLIGGTEGREYQELINRRILDRIEKLNLFEEERAAKNLRPFYKELSRYIRSRVGRNALTLSRIQKLMESNSFYPPHVGKYLPIAQAFGFLPEDLLNPDPESESKYVKVGSSEDVDFKVYQKLLGAVLLEIAKKQARDQKISMKDLWTQWAGTLNLSFNSLKSHVSQIKTLGTNIERLRKIISVSEASYQKVFSRIREISRQKTQENLRSHPPDSGEGMANAFAPWTPEFNNRLAEAAFLGLVALVEGGIFRYLGLMVFPSELVAQGLSPVASQLLGVLWAGPVFFVFHAFMRWVKNLLDPNYRWAGWSEEISADLKSPLVGATIIINLAFLLPVDPRTSLALSMIIQFLYDNFRVMRSKISSMTDLLLHDFKEHPVHAFVFVLSLVAAFQGSGFALAAAPVLVGVEKIARFRIPRLGGSGTNALAQLAKTTTALIGTLVFSGFFNIAIAQQPVLLPPSELGAMDTTSQSDALSSDDRQLVLDTLYGLARTQDIYMTYLIPQLQELEDQSSDDFDVQRGVDDVLVTFELLAREILEDLASDMDSRAQASIALEELGLEVPEEADEFIDIDADSVESFGRSSNVYLMEAVVGGRNNSVIARYNQDFSNIYVNPDNSTQIEIQFGAIFPDGSGERKFVEINLTDQEVKVDGEVVGESDLLDRVAEYISQLEDAYRRADEYNKAIFLPVLEQLEQFLDQLSTRPDARLFNSEPGMVRFLQEAGAAVLSFSALATLAKTFFGGTAATTLGYHAGFNIPAKTLLLFLPSFSIGDFWWPLLLIVFGVLTLYQSGRLNTLKQIENLIVGEQYDRAQEFLDTALTTNLSDHLYQIKLRKLIDKLLGNNSHNARLILFQAKIKIIDNNETKAEDLVRRAIKRNQGRIRTYETIVAMYASMNLTDRAEHFAQIGAEMSPQIPRDFQSKAAFNMYLGRYVAAWENILAAQNFLIGNRKFKLLFTGIRNELVRVEGMSDEQIERIKPADSSEIITSTKLERYQKAERQRTVLKNKNERNKRDYRLRRRVEDSDYDTGGLMLWLREALWPVAKLWYSGGDGRQQYSRQYRWIAVFVEYGFSALVGTGLVYLLSIVSPVSFTVVNANLMTWLIFFAGHLAEPAKFYAPRKNLVLAGFLSLLNISIGFLNLTPDIHIPLLVFVALVSHWGVNYHYRARVSVPEDPLIPLVGKLSAWTVPQGSIDQNDFAAIIRENEELSETLIHAVDSLTPLGVIAEALHHARVNSKTMNLVLTGANPTEDFEKLKQALLTEHGLSQEDLKHSGLNVMLIAREGSTELDPDTLYDMISEQDQSLRGFSLLYYFPITDSNKISWKNTRIRVVLSDMEGRFYLFSSEMEADFEAVLATLRSQ